MVQLRRGTRDAVGPDGEPSVGRGYEVCDDDGSPMKDEALHPDAFAAIAVVEVAPVSVEERQELKDASFGVGRPVTLRVDDEGVQVLDTAGRLRAGRVAQPYAAATAALLEREAGLAAWVSWEWLQEEGRTGILVALSERALAPQRLDRPAQAAGAGFSGLLAGRRAWIALAAVVVLILVVFASCF